MIKQEVKDKIDELIQSYGRFPKIEELAQALGANVYQTQLSLKSLVNDGFLTMQGNWYRKNPDYQEPAHSIQGVVSANKTETNPLKELFHPILNSEPSKEPEESEGDHAWAIPVLRVVMALIGSGALVVSIYYTCIWLLENMPPVLAVLLSIIMVGFSVFAFEVVVLFASKEVTDAWWRWGISLFFLVLWAIVSVFSITSTIAGQYNQNATKLEEKAQLHTGLNVSRARWAIITDNKNRIQAQIDAAQAKITDLRASLPSAEEIKTNPKKRRQWDNIQWQITVNNRSIDNLNKDKTIEQNKAMEELNANPDVVDEVTGTIPDFYGWVAQLKLFGITSREQAQFWLSLFPAVFVDVIAPAAFAIALFLSRRRKKSTKEVSKEFSANSIIGHNGFSM